MKVVEVEHNDWQGMVITAMNDKTGVLQYRNSMIKDVQNNVTYVKKLSKAHYESKRNTR